MDSGRSLVQCPPPRSLEQQLLTYQSGLSFRPCDPGPFHPHLLVSHLGGPPSPGPISAPVIWRAPAIHSLASPAALLGVVTSTPGCLTPLSALARPSARHTQLPQILPMWLATLEPILAAALWRHPGTQASILQVRLRVSVTLILHLILVIKRQGFQVP